VAVLLQILEEIWFCYPAKQEHANTPSDIGRGFEEKSTDW
jgi:hypothetical protein